jgi:GR25 family glycosyltransferase involved in LPS biosynthesis
MEYYMSFITQFFHQFDHVLCLSLKNSLDRRAHIAELVSQHNINNLKFFDAVHYNDPIVNQYYSNNKVKKFPCCFRCGELSCGDKDCNNTLIPAQVATFLSYVSLWQYIVESKITNVLIIEDDIVLSSTANQHTETYIKQNLHKKSEILCEKPMLIRFGWALSDEHHLSTKIDFDSNLIKMSNPAHAINGSMAKLLLEKFERIDTTVDIFQHRIIANKLNSKTAFPPLFYEMSWSTGEVQSLIHPKQIRLDYLKAENMQKTTEFDIAQQQLEQHKKHTDVYPILALGHPRCGSGYTASLLSAFKQNVGHEQLLTDGICSWMFAVFDQYPFAGNDGAKNRDFKYFKHIIHHVRSPLASISSIIRDDNYSEVSNNFRRKHIKINFDIDVNQYDNSIERAVASYIYWNKIIENQNPNISFRVEDQQTKLYEYLLNNNLINSSIDFNSLPSKDINQDKKYKGVHYDKQLLSYQDILGINIELRKELNQLCRKYGYDEFLTDEEHSIILQKKIDSDTRKFSQLTLKPRGWTKSAELCMPVDASGNPLPWWTYSAIEFVESIITNNTRVFEFGCGNSSLWWQERVYQVISVDHDSVWVDKISKKISSPNVVFSRIALTEYSQTAQEVYDTFTSNNPKMSFEYDSDKVTRRGLNDKDFISYASSILNQPGKFDCIVIDGMARRLCCYFAIKKLSDNGIIIFDNSNRSDYLEGYQYLIEQGFYQIRFSGTVPGAHFPSCTSLFIKSLDAFPKVVFNKPAFNIPEY